MQITYGMYAMIDDSRVKFGLSILFCNLQSMHVTAQLHTYYFLLLACGDNLLRFLNTAILSSIL